VRFEQTLLDLGRHSPAAFNVTRVLLEWPRLSMVPPTASPVPATTVTTRRLRPGVTAAVSRSEAHDPPLFFEVENAGVELAPAIPPRTAGH